MNTCRHPNADARGSAIVVVLAVLVLILAFMAANNVTLRALNQEIRLLEQRQGRKYRALPVPPGTADRPIPADTNAAPAAARP